jgi:methionine-rich copper-binding protein CopC
MSMLDRLVKAGVLAGALLWGPLAFITPVLAHAELKSASAEVRLNFSEALELAFAKVSAVGADGAAVSIGALALDPADPATLIIPLTGPAVWPLTLQWAVVSADGHKMEGHQTLPAGP